MNIQILKDAVTGKYLAKTIRVCDLIGLYFSSGQDCTEENMPYIHIQCWMRLIHTNRVLVSSEEMYGTQLAVLNTPTHLLCNQMSHGNIHVTERYYIALSKNGIDVLRKNLEQL